MQEETNGEELEAGLYRHPNGQELITLYDPLFGNTQSEAVVRAGFEYVGPAPEGSVKSLPELQSNSPQASPTDRAVLELLRDREQHDKDFHQATDEAVAGVAEQSAVPGHEETKAAAVGQIEARDQAPAPVFVGEPVKAKSKSKGKE